jgi:Trp operon repressor
MSKFKIEHGASKVNLVMLKTNIEDSISNDIDLMCQWSDNERKYIVNELLRFALTQEEDFLKYKASHSTTATRPANGAKSAPTPIKPITESVSKTDYAAAHA